MNKKLQLLIGLFVLTVLLPLAASAQINYTQGFEDDNHGWSVDGNFEVTDEAPCGGSGAFRANAYSFLGFFTQEGETMSPSLGISNGMPITVAYNYMVVDYASEPPFTSVVNAADWGTVTIEYATSASGPWLPLDTIDPTTYNESDTCQAKAINMTLTAGLELFMRIHAEPNAEDTDYYFYIDDLSVTQPAAPDCSGAPAASSAVSSVATSCTNEAITLSLQPAYALNGLTYQWQSSTDNVTYTNVASGGTSQQFSVIQTANTWYRAIISCGSNSTTSAPVQVMSSGQVCYCDIEFSDTVEPITQVTIGSISNTSSATLGTSPQYEDFTATVAPATLVQGVTYPITLKGNTNGDWIDNFTIYIDFNQDGDFADAGESFDGGSIENSTGTDNVQSVAQIAIPANAMTGTTRMRIVKLYEEEVAAPCGTGEDFFFGQAEDYAITIAAPQACTTAPTLPVIEAEDTSLCGTQGTSISLTTMYDQSGITYIWQSSPDGTTFTDITGATEDEYEVPAITSGSVWYRIVAICSNGNLSTPSEPVQITLTSDVCYCEVTFTEAVEPITSVNIGTLDNMTSPEVDESDEVEDFTGMDAPILVLGESYPITLMGNTAGTTFTNFFTVFFDWNRNGSLDDEGEMFEIGSIQGSTGTDNISVQGDIVVPEDAELGYIYMRVIKRYNTSPTDPCGTYTYGQAEDYRVYVTDVAGRGDFGNNAISFHPNPVKDVLNLTHANGTIDSIAVYNLLGQQVLVAKAGSNTAAVDMSGLAAGSYIVKAMSGDTVKTIKVVKQ